MASGSFEIRPAAAGDVPALFALVNAAYEIETLGSSPVGFKKTLRLVEMDECSGPVDDGRVFVAVSSEGKVVGTVFYDLNLPAKTVAFGPYAVDPSLQRAGVGKALLEKVEEIGKANGAEIIQLEIVNHRRDLVPLYRKRGFVPLLEEPFFEHSAWRLGLPSHFVVFRRLIDAPATLQEGKTMPSVLRLLEIPLSSSSPQVRLRMGERKDLPACIALVNEAYEVEEGDSPIAFKKPGQKRLMNPSVQTEPWVNGTPDVNFVVAEATDGSGQILGCIVADLTRVDQAASLAESGKKIEPALAAAIAAGRNCVHFGPFAVAKAAQGKGVGKRLLEAVEAYAMANKATVDIEVVSTRDDVKPMYEKRGYKVVGTAPWKAWEMDIIAREVHFLLMQKDTAAWV